MRQPNQNMEEQQAGNNSHSKPLHSMAPVQRPHSTPADLHPTRIAHRAVAHLAPKHRLSALGKTRVVTARRGTCRAAQVAL